MKKILSASLLLLSLIAGSSFAADQIPVTVNVLPGATVVGHVYDSNGNVIASFAGSHQLPGQVRFTPDTRYVYLGASVITKPHTVGGIDLAYTQSCFDTSNGQPIYVTAPYNFNTFNGVPTCPPSQQLKK